MTATAGLIADEYRWTVEWDEAVEALAREIAEVPGV